MWTLRRSLGEVLGDVRRMLDEVCPLRAPSASVGPSTTQSGGEGSQADGDGDDHPPAPEPDGPTNGPADWPADVAVPFDPDAPVPPGPWRWRWVWPGPGRPAGMALIAADGSLVLWSPGGFASHLVPPDGRPTPEVAAALASLPTLSDEAATAADLRVELDKARATAREARLLLHRAADAVDDAIDRRQGGPTG